VRGIDKEVCAHASNRVSLTSYKFSTATERLAVAPCLCVCTHPSLKLFVVTLFMCPTPSHPPLLFQHKCSVTPLVTLRLPPSPATKPSSSPTTYPTRSVRGGHKQQDHRPPPSHAPFLPPGFSPFHCQASVSSSLCTPASCASRRKQQSPEREQPQRGCYLR